MYTTEINKTGRNTNGQKVVNTQAYVIRKAPIFGLTVLSTAMVTRSNPVNIDYVNARLHQVVNARKDRLTHGQGAEFVHLAGMAGVTLNATLTYPGPSNTLAGSITTTSALINWDDQLIPGYNDVNYDVEVAKVSDSTVVKSATGLVASQYSATGLTTLTAYKARTRTRWGGTNISAWTAYTTFTTL